MMSVHVTWKVRTQRQRKIEVLHRRGFGVSEGRSGERVKDGNR